MAGYAGQHANFTDAVKTNYDKRLLTRALPRLVHARFGMQARVNKGFGSIELRKYTGLSAVSTPIDEGVTPSQQATPTVSTITITPLWYGAWLGYTDELDLIAYDPIVSEMVGILGEQAGLSIDTLVRNAITDGATVDYSNGVAARTSLAAVTDKISFSDIIIQIAELEAENAMPLEGGGFAMVAHPHTWATLMQDDTFVTLFTREGGAPLRSGVIGKILNCPLYLSSNAREYADGGASSADVYSMLFIAKESFGLWGLANLTPNYGSLDNGGAGYTNRTGSPPKPLEIIMMAPGSAGSLDPLKQRGTIAWKCAHEEEILNASWLRNLEHINDFS
jgi:N4-gp56 family major capsid protein